MEHFSDTLLISSVFWRVVCTVLCLLKRLERRDKISWTILQIRAKSLKNWAKIICFYSGKGGTRNYLNHIHIYLYTFYATNNTTARVLETGKRKDNDTGFMLQSNSTSRVLLKKGQEKRAQNLLFTLFNHDDEVLQHSLGWWCYNNRANQPLILPRFQNL